MMGRIAAYLEKFARVNIPTELRASRWADADALSLYICWSFGDPVDLIQIILFASVALFFAIRLYSVLGRRTGHEPEADDAAERPVARDADASDRSLLRPAFTGPAAAGLEAIRAADGVFDPEDFIVGATEAYGLIVTAFAAGDRGALQTLLKPDVMARYEDAIKTREDAGRTQIVHIADIADPEIESAGVNDGLAQVEVRFIAELATATKNADGEVVEGDANQLRRVTELWMFERPVDASTPNWVLARVKTA